MNIDERLEALTARLEDMAARHEALAQTVEIVAGMQEKNERTMAALMESIGELRQRDGELGEFIRSLARIAEGHEHRISGLEERREL